MEIKKDVCVDVIKTNLKGINKKLFILEKLIYNTELTDENEFFIDAVSESIDSVKDCLGGIETVVNYLETKDDEKDKEIGELKAKLNAVYGVKNNFRSTKYLAKERFIQLYEEHLNTGTAPYKLCKKYHLSPSTYYKYLKMYNEGGNDAL